MGPENGAILWVRINWVNILWVQDAAVNRLGKNKHTMGLSKWCNPVGQNK